MKNIEDNVGQIAWDNKKLIDISTIIMGQSPSSENYNNEMIGMPLIQGNADIEERKTKPRTFTSQITKTCDINDILITVRAPVGSVSKSLHNAVIGRGVAAIKANINNEFLYQYLISIENTWERISQGSTFTAINSDDLKKLKVPVPSEKEQDKIAEILSTWDDAISTINKNIEFETRRKKAIVSKVYRGNLSDDPNNSSHFQRLKKYLVEVKKKNGTGDLSVLSVSNSKGFILQEEQFERVIASKDRSNYKVVEKDQFAYNPSRVNVGSIDLMVEYDKGILSPMYVVFKCLKGLESRYLYHFLKSDLFLQMIPKYTQGSVRDSLAFSGLTSMKMYIPLVQEQNSYINLLDSIDRKISLLNNEVEFLKKQKQGLMQQLLTGKIRVKVS